MAAFNANTFAYSSYATARPDYPPSLYELILSYHHGNHDSLLDLGCGHGTITRALAPRFKHATGADPSEGMLQEARRIAVTTSASNIKFVQATAESLPQVEDASIDLVVAGQAAHWFPYPPDRPSVWDKLGRVVKPGGSVAFWGYADPVFPECAFASATLHEWAYGEGEVRPGRVGMGGHWPFPGRARIETLYGGLPVPGENEGWTNVKWVRNDPRVEHEWYREAEQACGKVGGDGRDSGVSEQDRAAVKMEKKMAVEAVKEFVRTWSGYHNWSEAHPDVQFRDNGGEGDVVDWIIDEIAEREIEWRNDNHEVVVEWPIGMLLLRRK